MADHTTQAMLTKTQRDFLEDQEGFYSGDDARQRRYDRRQAIIKRVRQSLHDFTYLLEEMEPQYRNKIFEDMDEELFYAIECALTFLFLGITDELEVTDDVHRSYPFESALEDALYAAYLEHGVLLESVRLDIESRPLGDVAELIERIESRDELTPGIIRLLLDQGILDSKPIEEEVINQLHQAENRSEYIED